MIQGRESSSIICFNNKEYFFSIKGILLFLTAGPLCVLLLYLFLEMDINDWLKEFIAKQTSFFLNLIGNANAQAIYTPLENPPWKIYISYYNMNFYISTWCTAAHIFSIFIGIIIFIPHPKNHETRKGIIWRKIKVITFLLVIIYIGNLFRIIILLGSALAGINWEFIHQFLNLISGILAAIIFIITVYKTLPEFFISIYYLSSIINQKFKKKK